MQRFTDSTEKPNYSIKLKSETIEANHDLNLLYSFFFPPHALCKNTNCSLRCSREGCRYRKAVPWSVCLRVNRPSLVMEIK